jgi:hypothetical protein
MSRAQKGFTKSRYLQEVVLNISGSIAYCEKNNISGAVVSIDQAKAFDTIWHGFVRASYKFFGVGDTFLNMLDTLGTNRQAQIILPGGKISNPFTLGTGRPQGGNLSPLEFNAGEQILILKLELDPLIKSVYSGATVPRSLYPVDPEMINKNFSQESNGETDKTDAFADDSTVVTLADPESLSELKKVLQDFAGISGLKCNFDKTSILLVGPQVQDQNFIIDLGFSVVNELKLLGFNINNEGVMCDFMFSELYRKIAQIINNWSRFRLSLQGRIGIYKTLCLSQLSFVGSICSPQPTMLNRIQDLMSSFVVGNLKVAKEKLYREPDEGGLNLININNFLIGLQSVWVKRAHLSSRDNWRVDLRNITYGNPYILGPQLMPPGSCKLLGNISTSFEKFTKAFYLQERNYVEAYIVNNNAIKRGENTNLLIGEKIFSGNRPILKRIQVYLSLC